MATINGVEDLKVWVRARELAALVFKLSKLKAFSSDWELRSQINAAAGSVMDNIAEGFGRRGNREFISFLSIASGSLAEVRSQILRANDRAYISSVSLEETLELINLISKMISGLIRYLKQTDQRGQKFNTQN
ncbi:MAG: hypothetical protein RIQ34_752 [Bacteroidota bacterium]|jgi:four helix bundle protein